MYSLVGAPRASEGQCTYCDLVYIHVHVDVIVCCTCCRQYMHIHMHVHKMHGCIKWMHGYIHQVRLQKCRVVLEALNILESEDSQVSYILCDTLKRVVFVAGDYVIREGQEAAGMYFISSGLVEVSGGRAAATPTHSHAAPCVRAVRLSVYCCGC